MGKHENVNIAFRTHVWPFSYSLGAVVESLHESSFSKLNSACRRRRRRREDEIRINLRRKQLERHIIHPIYPFSLVRPTSNKIHLVHGIHVHMIYVRKLGACTAYAIYSQPESTIMVFSTCSGFGTVST